MFPTMDQMGGQDDEFLSQGIQEVARVFEEPVIVKRFTGTTGGNDPLMIGAVPQFTSIRTTANITVLEAKEVAFPNSIYAIGDLRAEFLIPIYGLESQAGDGAGAARQADQVTYRGRTYRIVGHVQQPQLGGGAYYQAVLRQM